MEKNTYDKPVLISYEDLSDTTGDPDYSNRK